MVGEELHCILSSSTVNYSQLVYWALPYFVATTHMHNGIHICLLALAKYQTWPIKLRMAIETSFFLISVFPGVFFCCHPLGPVIVDVGCCFNCLYCYVFGIDLFDIVSIQANEQPNKWRCSPLQPNSLTNMGNATANKHNMTNKIQSYSILNSMYGGIRARMTRLVL